MLFFGTELPQVAAHSGDARSYAEPLFHYLAVGALVAADVGAAIRQPIEYEGNKVDGNAIREILARTKGYPYNLEKWGYQVWMISEGPGIKFEDASKAAGETTKRLQEGLFKVRFNRLTPIEREYVIAIIKLGAGPYGSLDVADALKKIHQSLGPRRAQIISNGMIYSLSHGDIAFAVPMVDEYLIHS